MDKTQQPPGYTFPDRKLKRKLSSPTRIPLVLVACGSFSPITYLHMRLFEVARDWTKFNTDYEVVGCFLSPVGDKYVKAGLASAPHRLNMCELATRDSEMIDVDPWEAYMKEYQPTAIVLDHFDYEINEKIGGIETGEGQQKAKARIALLAGADLIQTFSAPGVWSEKDLDHILNNYKIFAVERAGTDIDDALATLGQKFKDNIYVVHQLIQNDVSSTKIRLFLKRDMSVRYLIPQPVIQYIDEHGLYGDDGTSSVHDKEKGKAIEPASSSSNGP
ncbi:Nucleotidylyl transferase [Rhizodiscina lignyota]|uniref:Nicotinamide-nucleotide adenylyltransferase n=1 Tax=Rhizodiscina lignyota TaxID=1504668 RepID=A0A9P4M5T1_9PEZI|nr:Nucleotidylyl transferase [Rhizodiscina lignyota]